ncbi:MAG TPA: LCP family protein [Acidimicrobiia bacterium]
MSTIELAPVEQRHRRRPLAAALLSALVPGAGQWYAGRIRRGVVVFAPLPMLLIAAALAGATVGITDIVSVLVQPRVIWVLLGGNLAIAAWRLFAAADAYLLVAGAGRPRLGALMGLVAGMLFVAAPHAVAGVYGLRGIDLLETVFVADEPLPNPTLPTVPVEDRVPDPVTIVRPTVDARTVEYRLVGMIFQKGVGDPDAIAIHPQLVGAATAGAPFLPFTQRVDDDRITVLVSGGDAGPGRIGLRTDTMIVATVDANTGQAALFGIPRNFRMVPLPRAFEEAFIDIEGSMWEEEVLNAPDRNEDGFPDTWVDLDGDELLDPPEFESCACFPEILNALHGRTSDWYRSYPGSPDPGMDVLADVIGNLLDLHIDYWMLVDMSGFVKLVDAMGGVDVHVTQPLHVMVSAPEEGLPKARINVEPGLNHLSGTEALAYVRWRIGSSDYARMQRQRCMLRAVAAEADPVTVLRSFNAIADAVQTSVITNIPLSYLPDLVQVMGKVETESVATVGFVPPTYNDGRAPGGYPIPDVDRIRWKVAQVLGEGANAQSSTGESECGF